MKYYIKNTSGAWGYTLLLPQYFICEDIDFKNDRVYLKNGKLIAWMRGHKITLYAGYSWNGCSVIGRIIETEGTLRASLLHDALYQIAEQAGYCAPYDRRDADAAFWDELPWWACLPWWGAVRLFGWASWGGSRSDLIIKAGGLGT